MNQFLIEKRIWFSKKASPNLRSLKPVFVKLASVHQDYILGESGKDNLYGYGERPHVGLLAAVVWLSGGTALEEYGASKGKNKSRKGRCDLWIRRNKVTFECEAKRLWLNLKNHTEVLTLKLDKELKSAAKEVGSQDKKNQKRLALCFAIPGILNNKSELECGGLDKRICDLISAVKRDSVCDALIWIGFKIDSEAMGESHLIPGLLLAIMEL